MVVYRSYGRDRRISFASDHGFALAYRMLGTQADAEEVVQEAWLRWNAADVTRIESSEAWLITVVTRMSIDRLRVLRRERETYEGFWLPVPLVAAEDHTPEAASILASEVSYALLWLMERLTPLERAAYLLREVFDQDYVDIAAILNKTEAACRQLVHRAARQIRMDTPRHTVDINTQRDLLQRFIDATNDATPEALRRLVAQDAELVGDGGGKVPSFHYIMRGNERIAHLYASMSRKYEDRLAYRVTMVNGRPGLLRYIDDELESVQACTTDGTSITGFYVVRNPDKFPRLL